MDNLSEDERSIMGVDNVIIGDGSSRLSSTIFFLLCFVPVFATILFGAVDNTTWVIISIFWAAIILLWLAEAWKGHGFLLNPSPLQIPLMGWVLIGLVQLLPLGGHNGDLPGMSISQTLSLNPYGTRFFIIRLVIYVVFFAACLTFINNERRLKKIVLMVVIFGASMAFFGILQRLANPGGNNGLYDIYGFREAGFSIPFGPFFNQHHFAAFMEMTGGLTLGLLFGKHTGRDKRALLTIAIVVMGVAIVMTSSRGGLLGFVSILAIVILLNFVSRASSRESESDTRSTGGIQRKLAIAAGGAALIFVIFGVVLFLGGNDSLLRGIGVSAAADVSNGRFHFWAIAMQIFFEHPILGAGLDAFGNAFTKHDTWSGVYRVDQAHNEYLQTLADAGVAGFVCLVGFIYLLFRKGLATIANAGNGFRKDASIGALAGCFGILIHSFFDFPLRTCSNAFFFLILVAIATVPIRTSLSDVSKRRRSSNAR